MKAYSRAACVVLMIAVLLFLALPLRGQGQHGVLGKVSAPSGNVTLTATPVRP